MKKLDNIKKSILLLLSNEKFEPSVELIYDKIIKIVQNEKTNFFNVVQNNSIVLVHKQILAIKAIYEQSSTDIRKEIYRTLINCLDSEYAIIALKTLYYLGFVEDILKKCVYSFSRYNQIHFIYFFNTISFLLAYQSNLIDQNNTEKLYDWIEKYFDSLSSVGKTRYSNAFLYAKYTDSLKALRSQVNILLSQKLIKDIYSGFNPEINQDEKKLKEQFNRFGFPKDLSETLDKIDDILAKANDGFDYKNCMGLIRSFTERFYSSISIELDQSEGRKIDVTDSKIVAKFFVEKNLISSLQAEFLMSSRHFLSNAASHRLKSLPEECRLSRNIIIEFSLFIFERLKTLKAQ